MAVSEAQLTSASQVVKAGARKAYKLDALERSAQYAEEDLQAEVEMEEWNTKFYAMGVFSILLVILSHSKLMEHIGI
jgi:hypothetical protein